MQMEYYLRQTI